MNVLYCVTFYVCEIFLMFVISFKSINIRKQIQYKTENIIDIANLFVQILFLQIVSASSVCTYIIR